MPKDAKRRFVELDTEEVSLVDSPANEVEFLVKKNQEDRMGAQAEQNDEAVRVASPAGDGEHVAKAVEHVNSIIDKITKMVPTQKAEEPEETKTAKAEEEEATETPTLKSVLSMLGLKGEAMEAAVSKLKGAGLDADMAFPSAQEPVAKAEEAEETEEVNEDTPLTIGALQKAAAFTPGRTKKLEEAYEALKLVLEAIGVGQSPSTKAPTVESHGNPSGVNALAAPKRRPVMKSEEEPDFVEAIKSLATAVGSLTERVESVEKAREASNSVEDEGTTDSNVKKSSGMWSGIL